MSRHGALETVAWAAAGAALLGGGMLVGFASALLGRPRSIPVREPAPTPDPTLTRRVEELAAAVAEIDRRVSALAAPAKALDAVSQRVEQLERRVEQLAAQPPAAPSLEQILAAVEQMVAARIGSLDERLSDQVRAIDLLRHASAQTDTLLQRLIQAVESLAEHPPEPSELKQQ